MDAKTAVGLLKDHNYRSGWQNAKEIADLIEQQARQIQAMRNCNNCRYGDRPGCEEPCCYCLHHKGKDDRWEYDDEY